jgi:hypothetical protein
VYRPKGRQLFFQIRSSLPAHQLRLLEPHSEYGAPGTTEPNECLTGLPGWPESEAG